MRNLHVQASQLTIMWTRVPFGLLSLLLIFGFASPKVAAQATYTDLYEFRCTPLDFSAMTSTGTCNPVQPGILAQGIDGNLYGMACDYFTPCNYGSIFRMSPSGDFTLLFKFDGTASSDGTTNKGITGGVSGLTLGPDGNFYGVTPYGGYISFNCGTIFQATPSGTVYTLHKFDNTDGCYPIAPPVLGDDGYFYGTAANVAYRINAAGDFHVLTSSLPYGPSSPPTGTSSPLLLASDGNFYGVASQANNNGGLGFAGTLYRMTKDGIVTVLYNFFDPTGQYLQGQVPFGGLVEGADGNLYGTTTHGGSSNYGTVFQLTKSGSIGWAHSFPSVNISGGSYLPEGGVPYAGVIASSDGNLYGATSFDGCSYGCYGTLFRTDYTGNVDVLYAFEAYSNNCGTGGFNCGIEPYSQPMQATSGFIYGMADYGGSAVNNGQGTGVFYRLDLTLPPFVTTIQPSAKPSDIVGILGQGFSEAIGVSFNGVAASFNVVSDTYLKATVPAGAATGLVTVTFANSAHSLSTNRNFRILAISTLDTSVSVDSLPNPSVLGQSVTLSAMVTTADNGSATGMITFYDGTNALGSSTVLGNGATLNVNVLSAGSHSITAIYSGDSKYQGGTSMPPLTQVVNAPVTSSNGWLSASLPPFGSVSVGASISQTVILSVNSALTLSSLQANGDFSVTGNGCPLNVSLPPPTVCSLIVQFSPTAAGQRWSQLTVQDNSGNTYKFGLEGVGLGATLAFTPGIIGTAAGNGTQGNTGDGGPPLSASFGNPTGVTIDSNGNLYIADPFDASVREVDASTGTISTLAGNGSAGFSGDGGPASSASLTGPYSVALDSAGNLFIAEIGGHRVRKVDSSTHVITTVAGIGTSGFSGDGGPATSAMLYSPSGVVVDSGGNLYIADSDNQRIRKVDSSTGVISTIAGNGVFAFGGDGGAATSASLASPYGLAIDAVGNLYIADRYNHRVRKVDAVSGNISTVAGNGVSGFTGDGGAATNCSLNIPFAVAEDAAGNLYIADTGNYRIRKVDVGTGTINTVAGNGASAFAGDGGPATVASLFYPSGVAVGPAGSVFVADGNDWRVRKVDVSIAPTLAFATLQVGQTSSAQSVAVSNVGNTPLVFSQFSTSANFALQNVGNDCSTATQLPLGATCYLGVVFTPTIAGNPLNGTLTITDNASGSPQSVGLAGVGLGLADLSMNPGFVDFGDVNVGKSSLTFVTLTNNGSIDLTIGQIQSNVEPYIGAVGNTCLTTLSPGASCQLPVVFRALVAGLFGGIVSITDTTGDVFQLHLIGTAVAPALLSLSISPLNPIVLPGQPLQLLAIGTYSDGTTADLTTTVSWSSAQPLVASIGNTAGSQGLATGVATGTDVITATFGTISTTAPLTVDFALTGTLSTGRSLHTATRLNNGKVLIAGGVDSSGNAITAAELYDPSTGTFAPTGNLNTPRQYHTATLLNSGKVLIAGGCGTNCGGVLASSEIYDPATETFTLSGNLNVPRNIHTATLLNDGKVLIAGGYGGGILASAELYDPATGKFSPANSLNTAREWHDAVALNDGRVLLTGGYYNGLLSAAELYDPVSGNFTSTGSLNIARDVHSSTLLNNGQVLIVGGWGGGANDVPSAELYDPVSGTFAPTGSLTTARQLHTATLLNNGKVLIAGGSDTNGNYFATAEVYDPALGTFAATGNLNTARDPHTATLLSNGNVLVVGGANSSRTLASAELFVTDTLVPANLASIVVTPASSTIDLGANQQFTATGTFVDHSTAQLQSVAWGVSDTNVATITNDVTNRGTVLGFSSGSATITACTGHICGSADLIVGSGKVSLSPTSLAFGNESIGTSSATQSITLSNTGNGTLSIASISLAGASFGDFTESTTCGTTLAPGGACNINVVFVPTATGTRSASVSIADNGSGSPQAIPVSGTGVSATTTTTVTSSANPSVFNQPVTFAATVTSPTGAPGGTVTVSDGANALGSATVSGGLAILTVPTLTVGSHSVIATYGGDTTHSSSVSLPLTQSVSKATTTTAIASSKNPQQVGQPITLTATVTSQFGGAASGSIVFKSGNTTLGTVALNGNQANLTTSFSSAGTRSITAQYAGDTNNAASTSSVLSQSVVAKFPTTTTLTSSLNPSFIGQAVTFTATVTSTSGTPPDGELISFRRGGTALGTAPLSGGVAMFTTATLPTGSSNITAVFAADAAFTGSTSAPLAQVVNKYNTSIAFASSVNPSLYGQSVTLIATVISAGPMVPTGNVVFRNGSSNLATVALDSNGVATLTRTNLPLGTLSLTATYNGDTQSASSSAGLTQMVNVVPSTTTLVSSRNPSTSGQSVKFTATVTTNTGVAATGTVTFTFGANILGTANLSGGKASLTTTALPRGTDGITATYSGTANIASSAGSVSQQVN